MEIRNKIITFWKWLNNERNEKTKQKTFKLFNYCRCIFTQTSPSLHCDIISTTSNKFAPKYSVLGYHRNNCFSDKHEMKYKTWKNHLWAFSVNQATIWSNYAKNWKYYLIHKILSKTKPAILFQFLFKM